ncbi:MAG TPA: AmmeMemoRadiSam system protein B [Bryobacteraceae bacterium]|nr:AmmeMemoRadiSam system protein B [Bryobacteraceae bacterium]
MPSPAPDRPGLLIRDPFRYSDITLIVPPALVPSLQCFDGEQTDLDLKAKLVRATGDLATTELVTHLIDTLSKSGFLENEIFERMKDERQRSFAAAPKREAQHAGGAYPDEIEPLRATLGRYMGAAEAAQADGLVGIAAPHVSPEGGWQSYRAAYNMMSPAYRERTFVILGTSHYGEPERFGLTRKPFVTPFGETSVDVALVDWLEQQAAPAIQMEDYCHAVEHSIEFQVLFLQHLYGPQIRILPILCGPYAHSIYLGGKPEQDENVQRFLGALGELASREGRRLFWVLGIDMAHIGRRYGDAFTARADQGAMLEVAARDRGRIDRVTSGDAEGFWNLVQEKRDDLKWCGSSPLYTFLKAVPQVRGHLLRYEHWNIDEQSVVSFGGIAFSERVGVPS